MAVYLVRDPHFTPLKLVLMGTVMEASVFLFEIPTGVIADTYSRRLSLIIGYLGIGASLDRWWAIVSEPWAVIALWALWGISTRSRVARTRRGSPTRSATRTLVPLFLRGKKARVRWRRRRAGRYRSRSASGRCARAVVAGGAVTISCGLACIFLMPETAFVRRPRSERGSAVQRAAHDGFGRRALCLGCADRAPPDRRRALHGDVERGVRPAEGGALPP